MPFKPSPESSAADEDLEPLGQAATLGLAPISSSDVTPTNSPPHSPSPAAAAPIILNFGIQFRRFMSYLNSQGFTASDRMIPLLEKICQRMDEMQMTAQTAECELSLVCDPSAPSFASARATLARSSEHFNLLGVIELRNHPTWEASFARKRRYLCIDRDIQDENQEPLFCQLTNETAELCGATVQELLSQRKASLLGKGYYFAEDPLRANDYDEGRGNPQKVRFMAECNVALGRVYDFGTGRFDRDYKNAPVGHDSVKSFIKRAHDFVVYNPEQFRVVRIWVYTFRDRDFELTPPTALPKNTTGRVVFITASLSEFFTKIQIKADHRGDEVSSKTRELIVWLLQRKLHPEDFVRSLEKVLKAPSPPTLLSKLNTELAKSADPQSPQPPAPTVAVVLFHLNGMGFRITAVLDEFLNDIRMHFARIGVPVNTQMSNLISTFLMGELAVEEFLEKIRTILQKPEPYSAAIINELRLENYKTRIL